MLQYVHSKTSRKTLYTHSGPSVFCRPRSLAPDRLKIEKSELDHVLQLDISCVSDSSWSSPLHMASKPTPGGWSPCGDYRASIKVTILDRYAIPHIHELSSSLYGKSIFAKIDMYVHTIRFLCTQMTIRRHLVPFHLVYLSFFACHLAYVMLLKHFNDLSTKFSTSYILCRVT